MRVTRASSIRRPLSVHTQSPEGIEHGIREWTHDIRIRADGQQRSRFHHDGERLVLRRIRQWSRFDGAGGSSTIVQYDKAGNIEHSYSIAGSVDGLKYNPYIKEIWALQNQDGNSTLTLINPVTHQVTGPLSFANPSATRGYDDVVFKGNEVFLSFTNPTGNGDPTIVKLLNGPHPKPGDTLKTAPVLLDGAMGYDTVSGKMELVPQTDPDSLKLAANGDLIFSSGADGAIIDIQNPGTSQQAIAFTPIQGIPAASAGNAGLDDVIKPTATSGTFYISDAKDGRVLSVHATGLDPNAYYASVGSLNAFGQVDVGTGVFTALVSAQNAPGFTFGSPHGVAFVPDKNAAPSPQITAIKTFQAPTDGRPSGSACFHNAGPFGGIMAWVGWQASAWQGPTCCSVPAGCSPYRARRSRRSRSACRWPAG